MTARHSCVRALISRTLILLMLCVFLATLAPAQRGTGIVTGRAVDRQGAVLPGARVKLEPGDITGATNGQGEFNLIGVAPGDYTITISYVGFANFSGPAKVVAGQTTRVDAQLKVAAHGEEITVVADVQGQAEAIQEQRTSDNILDVMPEGVIQSLPNENVADVVGRMPGVSLERDEGEGKYVQVRGTEPRLNNTMVDGVEIPAPEGTVRQVKLDSVPSDIVESIEVNKTLAANQDADAIGGTVNLVTKKASDLPTLKFETIGGWTPILNTRYIGILSATAGMRFGHDKKFGALFSGSYDYNGRGIYDIEPSPDDVAAPTYGSMDLREYRYKRYRWGFAGSLDYKLNDPASGLFLHYFLSDFSDYGDKWVYKLENGGPPDFSPTPKFSTSNRLPDYGIGDIAIGGKHVFEKSWLSWEGSAARSRQTAAGGNPGADFQYNGFTSTVVNPFPFLNPTFIPLCPYVGAPNIHLPQFSLNCTLPGTPFFDPNQWTLLDVNTTVGITSQVNLQGAFSYARNYKIGSHTSTLEFGAKVRNAHKGQNAYSPTYDQTTLASTPPNCTAPNQSNCNPLMTQFLTGLSSPNYYFGAYRYGPVTDFSKITGDLNNLVSQNVMPLDAEQTQFTSDSGNFDLTERVSAAYAMNTIEMGRFRLQTGLRVEATQLNILGFVVTQTQNPTTNLLSAVTTPTPAQSWYWDPLPSVQLKYHLTDNDDIRAVYGRGISRPNP